MLVFLLTLLILVFLVTLLVDAVTWAWGSPVMVIIVLLVLLVLFT